MFWEPLGEMKDSRQKETLPLFFFFFKHYLKSLLTDTDRITVNDFVNVKAQLLDVV